MSRPELAIIPDWALEFCRKAQSRPRKVATDKTPLIALDTPRAIDRAIQYLTEVAPHAVDGDRGDHTTYQVAARVIDFGVSMDATFELMSTHWNDTKAEPPWRPDELLEKVQNAFKYRTSAPGSASAPADFDDVSDLVTQRERRSVPALTHRLPVTCAASLKGHPVPSRQWAVDGIIPSGEALLCTGNGGVGKSLLMQQLATAVATGSEWLGFSVRSGRVFALFCEDDGDELHRRQAAINESMFLDFEALRGFEWLSRNDIDDPILMDFERDKNGALTPFFDQLVRHLKEFDPAVVIVDTLTDTFGGDEVSRRSANTYAKRCAGRICRETGAAVVVCGHPSRAGMSSGDGLSGSTHWHNAFRSRLYLTAEKDDRRKLMVKKQNYGPAGMEFDLQWVNGVFRRIGPSLLTPADRTAAEDDAYLAGLALLKARDVDVVYANNQQHWAPRRILNLPEMKEKGLTLDALDAAQERMLRDGRISIRRGGSRGTTQYITLADPHLDGLD